MPSLHTHERHDLSWISLLSIALVAAYLVVMQQLEPVGWARAHTHTRFVLAIGYGHLLASLVGARKRKQPRHERRDRRQDRRLLPRSTSVSLRISPQVLSWTTALLLAHAVYTQACHLWPGLPLGLLGVSAWHTIENDRALRRGRLGSSGGIAPLSPSPRAHAIDIAATLASGSLVFVLPWWFASLTQTDVIVAFTLQHLFAWLVFSVARGCAQQRLRATLARLAWLHAPMIAACLLASTLLASAPDDGRAAHWLAAVVLDPSTYLFWSTAHVVHTAWRRRAGAER